MKMYKEMLRKLAPVGIPLAVATLLYTVITGGQNCFGSYVLTQSTSAVGITPVLVYYVFTAVVFAFYGFSFLFKRSASDLYHSFPVSRLDLYLSVTVATATWMGATILLNVLAMLALLLISGCPFVPAYIPLIILLYFVASMLVFAASAIGCALSGTYVTALASTLVVLFLPRFVQFVIARGIVSSVPIIGWLDFGIWLNPGTNVATGLVVMQSRNMFINDIVSLPHILYSLLPMALELALGAWLFIRRPSETADRGASSKLWSGVTASLISFAVLLLITIDDTHTRKLLSVYSFAICAIALLAFLLYQFVSLRNLKQVLKSLPFIILSAVLAFGVSYSIDSLVDQALDTTPNADSIVSVSFRGHDAVQGAPEYTSILLSQIQFTNEDLKQYVADSLSAAAENIRNPEDYYYDYDAQYQYQAIEPIELKLKDGRTVRRTIMFANIDKLNDLRSENTDFQAAVLALPPNSSVQSLSLGYLFTDAEEQAIWDSYHTETLEKALVSNSFYRSHAYLPDDYGYTYTRGGEQQIDNLYLTGYIGTHRYNDYFSLRLETPDTVSLYMRTQNSYAAEDTVVRLQQAIKHMLSPLALESDSVSLNLNFFNVPMSSGEPRQDGVSLYLSGYNQDKDTYAAMYTDFSQKFAEILQRGQFTDDCSGMFIRLNWNEYDGSNRKSNNEPDSFLSFSKEDQAALISLLQDWSTANTLGY